jgi:hypothetical protein
MKLAVINSYDGYTVRPILRYVAGRAVAPRIANRGRLIGAGAVTWLDDEDVLRSA